MSTDYIVTSRSQVPDQLNHSSGRALFPSGSFPGDSSAVKSYNWLPLARVLYGWKLDITAYTEYIRSMARPLRSDITTRHRIKQ